MSDADRIRWDDKYAQRDEPDSVGPPDMLAPFQHVVPESGLALDLGCGQGRHSVWLALRGLAVCGVDISLVAIERARELARRNGVGEHCAFDVLDLDDGLPPSAAVDVVLCHRFRDPRLDQAIVERLTPGGLLAMVTRSEVGDAPGHFRARPGELVAAFAELDIIDAGEGNGQAWLLARR